MSEVIPPDEQQTRMISEISRSLARQFHPDIDANDVYQELWVRWYTSWRYLSRYLELEDEGQRTAALSKSLRNHGVLWCQQEKAAMRGYQVEDVFYYPRNLLRELLPFLGDAESFTALAAKGERIGRSNKPAHEGGDAMAFLADLHTGWDRLTQPQRDLLWDTLVEPSSEEPYKTLGERLGITEQAAYMRVDRALGALQQHLGGPRPVERRKAMSNAQAAAQTRADYGGE